MTTLFPHNTLPQRPTWLEINLRALVTNVGQVRQLIGAQRLLMAVVKANAYGHGAIRVAEAFLHAGVDRLAVATLSEGVELRNAGVDAPVQVLSYTPSWLAAEALHHNLITTVYDFTTVEALNLAAEQAGRSAVVHVKINTGMNRLGLPPTDAGDFLDAVRRFRHVRVEGIFTHFATSDLADKSFAHQQFDRFCRLLDDLENRGLRPPLAHAANSAAVLTLPQTHLDMVRCGIALYGLHPDVEETPLPAGFAPALSWKAAIAHVLNLQPGDSVSYGREFIAQQSMTVAVVPVGYADGFPRQPYHWGHVLIHGQPAPVLGRVCMDQTIVDVTSIAEEHGPVRQGDEVVLIGQQRGAVLSAEDVGRRLHTINYDVVSRILGRVSRIYVS
jgi:alanine racemase